MKEKSTQPHYLTICIRWLVLPVSDPAAVLEDGAVDGAVGGEPALHPLEVGVGDRRRRGTHHLEKDCFNVNKKIVNVKNVSD